MNDDEIWNLLYSFNTKNESINDENPIAHCNGCKIETLDSTCRNCGLVITNVVEYSDYVFQEETPKRNVNQSTINSKLSKMQEWLKWTTEEKRDYKLTQYIKDICNKIQINEGIITTVCDFVLKVMSAIKESNNGPKRSRVKDGIIIICIHYVSKNSNTNLIYSYIDLAKKIDLPIKYISNADKLITDLINSSKLKIPEEFIRNIIRPDNPIDYVTKIISSMSLNVNPLLINQVSDLINICEDNDILVDHTPQSIGVVCFYYILIINNIDINIKTFADLYKLSMVTIMKTFNKLKTHKASLEKLGIKLIID